MVFDEVPISKSDGDFFILNIALFDYPIILCSPHNQLNEKNLHLGNLI